ncbi:hypothetical protein GDO78_001867 [Eleutherodactylus coqui]|uniref:Uncharacterized protein n=1 Tax=Eleutherodactylus coqui TaxID=57060 RepID=A0A8J6FX18_ELECQ|nr:hypothetical protein GDO78_001867 [Eleutherodactylus coqui]
MGNIVVRTSPNSSALPTPTVRLSTRSMEGNMACVITAPRNHWKAHLCDLFPNTQIYGNYKLRHGKVGHINGNMA